MNTTETIDKKEFDTAAEEAKASDPRFTIRLKEPVTYNGKEYTELTFDFDKLTGRDGLAIEEELSHLGKSVVAPVFSVEYLMRMAAKACTVTIGADLFDKLTLRDFNRLRNKARDFLLQSE